MDIQRETREASRLLLGIEEGSMNAADAFKLINERDPLTVWFLFRYLREKYPASNPSASGVLGRLVELTSTYPEIVAKTKALSEDSVAVWFEETYQMREFFDRPQEFVALIVEKVEG